MNGGVSRVTTAGSNKAMYYDGTGYISTPSFAISNTGLLTIEAWANLISLGNCTILADAGYNGTTGFAQLIVSGSGNLRLEYADGSNPQQGGFATNFFTGFTNQ